MTTTIATAASGGDGASTECYDKTRDVVVVVFTL